MNSVSAGRLSGADYEAYLLSPAWRKLREQALHRFEWRCALCNASSELEVHHRTYERAGFEALEDLVALCADCHHQHHFALGSGSL